MNFSRSSVRDRCTKAIAAVQKHLASEPAVPLGGRLLVPAALEAQLQSAVDAADAAVAASAAFRDASRAELAVRARTLAWLGALKVFVVLRFGADAAEVLADFGFSPRKQSARSADAKLLAVARSRATRAARKTMGPVQKRDVKGAVSTVTVTDPHAGGKP